MALITLTDAGLAYGLQPLLDGASLSVDEGERIGLIGRNGTGKSTLLSIVAGIAVLDSGELTRRDGLRAVRVEQEPVMPRAATFESSLCARGGIDELADERERWRLRARLIEYLHRFAVDPDASPAGASGGETKRAALALAFALEPTLLLLDEPTNHLDLDGIMLLEELLLKGPATIVITHDRAFLDRVATRIVELDRGLLASYPGNFAAYETRKDRELAAETTARRKFDRYWAQEEAWIRQGVEARRTRNEGRVRRLEQLRQQRAARRERAGDMKLVLDAGERSGRLVAELKGVTKSFGERAVVRGLDLTVMRGDRLGLVGPNGAGKTTLIRLITGELAPDAGSVRLGAGLTVAYFDQLRAQLDGDLTLAEAISPGSEWVGSGERRKHVMTYLGDFLFPPERARAPVRMLSGGERNRLLLARLFATSANLLVLDEPTNDLDIESLELLESTLQGYPGTLLLVSHDRTFLDNVVTQTLAAEGDGRWREYVGGYGDWLRQRPRPSTANTSRRREPTAVPASSLSPSPAPSPARTRLSYKEGRELAALPGEIEQLELEQRALVERMSSGDYHAGGAARVKADRERMAEIERLLEQKFERWAALDR